MTQPLWKVSWQFLIKLDILLLYNPASLLLDIYPSPKPLARGCPLCPRSNIKYFLNSKHLKSSWHMTFYKEAKYYSRNLLKSIYIVFYSQKKKSSSQHSTSQKCFFTFPANKYFCLCSWKHILLFHSSRTILLSPQPLQSEEILAKNLLQNAKPHSRGIVQEIHKMAAAS